MIPTIKRALEMLKAGECTVEQAMGWIEENIRMDTVAQSETASTELGRLWLWKNFVDGKPEYWAFDNPYPCHPNGDPITLGEPCGYAVVKPSTRGRKDVSDEQVIAAIKRAKP